MRHFVNQPDVLATISEKRLDPIVEACRVGCLDQSNLATVVRPIEHSSQKHSDRRKRVQIECSKAPAPPLEYQTPRANVHKRSRTLETPDHDQE